MGLNETLDRLAKEREEREKRMLLGDATIEDVAEECGDLEEGFKSSKITDLAERIFFQRMLKDINPGLSEPKIDAMIDRSVMIATKLYKKLYNTNK